MAQYHNPVLLLPSPRRFCKPLRKRSRKKSPQTISNMFNALHPTPITSQGNFVCPSSINSNINRDNTIQVTVEAAIVNQSDKITLSTSSSGSVSKSVSIEAQIPDKLKSKILSKQYVDFGSLLPRNKQGNNFPTRREFDKARYVYNPQGGVRWYWCRIIFNKRLAYILE